MKTIKRGESDAKWSNFQSSDDKTTISSSYLLLLLATVAAVSGIIGFTVGHFVFLSPF